MAKKKSIEEESQSVLGSNVCEKLAEQVKSEFKANVFKDASRILDKEQEIISWGPSLDFQLSGGVPTGSWILMSGPPKTCKTTSLLSLAAQFQQAGHVVVYGNVEHRLKKMNLQGIPGLKTDSESFRIIESEKGKKLGTIDFLRLFELAIQNIPGCFLLVDSWSALMDDKVALEGIGTETRGKNNIWISQFINNVLSDVQVNECTVAGVLHQYANTSGYGAAKAEKVSSRNLYQVDIKLTVKECKPWIVGDVEIGKETNFQVFTSALGRPGINATTYVRYDVGIDRAYEIMQLGMNIGLIDKAGAWYTASFLKNCPELVGEWNEDVEKSVKRQGEENFYRLLVSNPEWQKELNKQVNQMLFRK